METENYKDEPILILLETIAQIREASGMGNSVTLEDLPVAIFIYKERLNRELDIAHEKIEILESDIEALTNKKGMTIASLIKERDSARREIMDFLMEELTTEEIHRLFRSRGWGYLLP